MRICVPGHHRPRYSARYRRIDAEVARRTVGEIDPLEVYWIMQRRCGLPVRRRVIGSVGNDAKVARSPICTRRALGQSSTKFIFAFSGETWRNFTTKVCCFKAFYSFSAVLYWLYLIRQPLLHNHRWVGRKGRLKLCKTHDTISLLRGYELFLSLYIVRIG